jgi:polysaccharide biosynthesis protein PslH
MKALFVSHYLPYPVDKGASIRIFNIIKSLSEKHDIDIISFESDMNYEPLKKICNKIYLSPYDKSVLNKIKDKIFTVYKRQPWIVHYIYSKHFKKQLKQITRKNEYDIIHFEHTESAIDLNSIHSNSKAYKIYSLHNISSFQYLRHYQTEKRFIKKFKYLLTYWPMISWEPQMASKMDKVVVVSDMDRLLLKQLNPNIEAVVIPNGVDTNLIQPNHSNYNNNILFIGSMDYSPNVDAVIFLIHHIFPLLKKNNPDLVLTIAGRNPPEKIVNMATDSGARFEVNPFDLKPLYNDAMATIVPLRSGGGTRIKILESMAYGVPVISSSVGCEGLDVINGQNILIADEPNEYSTSLNSLIENSDLRNRISKNGRILVEKNYDWSHIADQLDNLWKSCFSGLQ